MARSGIYKSEVKKARDALLAQGRNPSIDAVRSALGDTGSKTTIHRYLKELEEEEGAGLGQGVAVSEAIQDLVGRLAMRLHEEAEARINELQAQHLAQLAERDATLAQLQQTNETIRSQLQEREAALQSEQTQHGTARQALQAAAIEQAQQAQQISGLMERLAENETHRQSLEDKHRHAREALEHYRESVKEQREQEQRRHELQVQQLQAELRTVNQTLIVKQNELTHAYQDAARGGAELVALRKDLRRSEHEAEKINQARDTLQIHVTQLEAHAAALAERIKQITVSRDDLRQALQSIERVRKLPTLFSMKFAKKRGR